MSQPADQPRRPVILIVDDSRVIRTTVAKSLGDSYELIEAEDGEEGWTRLNDNPAVSVVITDMEMPRLNGYGLTERIRLSGNHAQRHLPVIMLSGESDVAARDRAVAAGVSDFIIKPIDRTQLLARVKSYVEHGITVRALTDTERALSEEAGTDHLTHLANHHGLIAQGEQAVAYALRQLQNLSLIRFAIDDFESLTSRYDSDSTDAILLRVAVLLKAHVRREDTVARIADSDFAILTPAAGRFEAAVLAERLRNEIAAEQFWIDGQQQSLTISASIATVGRDPIHSFDAMQELADARLRHAQSMGGNRLVAQDDTAPATALVPDAGTALRMLKHGQDDRVTPHLAPILASLLPLLTLAEQKLAIDLNLDAIRSLPTGESKPDS